MTRPSEQTNAQAFFAGVTSASTRAAEGADSSRYGNLSDLLTRLELMQKCAELTDANTLLTGVNAAVKAAAESHMESTQNTTRVGFAMFPRAGATEATTQAGVAPGMSHD